jgi:hypothetical protein
LGGTVLDWPDGLSHAEQEKRLRDEYSRCALVVGDRLHGLVIAATEGAAPLGWVESSSGKIRRHFEAVGLEAPGRYEGSAAFELPEPDATEIMQIQEDTLAAIAEARRRIIQLRSGLAELAASSSAIGLSHLRRDDARARSCAARNTSE